MPDYRLYCLDGVGKIGTGEWLDAKNDDEAIVIARLKRLHTKCELWEQNRLVATIPGTQPS